MIFHGSQCQEGCIIELAVAPDGLRPDDSSAERLGVAAAFGSATSRTTRMTKSGTAEAEKSPRNASQLLVDDSQIIFLRYASGMP